MDILAALYEANPTPGGKRCKLAAFLDSIPEDAEGRDALIAAVDDVKAFPGQRLTLTFSVLGHPVSADTIRDHRAKRCRCYR